MKKILALLLCLSSAAALSGCGKDDYEGIDKDTQGSLNLLMWNGDGKYHENIGKQNWTKNDINGQTVADVYAVAKKFNESYPNISINLQTKSYGPDDINPDGTTTSWEQELELFKDKNGAYPDIWVSNNVTRDMSKGLVFDMTHFENDPVYQSYNPSLLSLTNFYGFQAGLPQYAIPQGVFINKTLADEQLNIDESEIPTPQWTWDEYTSFVSKAKPANDIYGSWDASMGIIKSTLIEPQLQNNTVTDAYIDVTTDEFKEAIRSLPAQANTALQSQYGLGFVTDAFMEEHGNYVTNFFADNVLLTLYDYMASSELGNMTIEGMRTYVNADSWDYYPIPSMDASVGNTVNILYDPMVMYNYAGNDNELSASEEAQAKIAYEFMSYYTASTEAWEARAAQEFTAGVNIYKTALSDSLPLIKAGDEFDKQMEIWYSTDNHKTYNEKDEWGNVKFPGFQYTVKLWGEGKISGVSGKAYPLEYIDSSANEIDCFYYLNGFGMPDVNGGNVVTDGDAWYSAYSAGLFEANGIMNDRFTESFNEVKNTLKNIYGFDEDKLK